MKVKLKIKRFEGKELATFKNYEIDVPENATLLDCLDEVKWKLDGSLTYRRNCKNLICGSCAMRCNGKNILACSMSVKQELAERDELIVEPMGNMPLIKDMVTDMNPFFDSLMKVEPWLQPEKIPEKEHLQSHDEREMIDEACIMCGACFGACNALEAEPKFIGPAALAKEWRYMNDSRDSKHDKRMDMYNKPKGIWDCTHCFYCDEVCPVGVKPMEKIIGLRRMAMNQGKRSPGARHHLAFEEIIEKSGWLNELKLPLKSAGINLKKHLELVPVGLRMMFKGKMPSPVHHPLENIKEVRDIYKIIRAEKQQEGVKEEK